MSLTFPIPDWNDEDFNYEGLNINGETSVKKQKSKKRKHDGDGTLNKGHAGVSDTPQQAFKKKKTGQADAVPEKKKMEGTKEHMTSKSKIRKEKKTKTTEVSHQEENLNHSAKLQTEANVKLVPGKKKKKGKSNNKYKELNKRQKEGRIAVTVLVGDSSESKQQDTMETEQIKESFQNNTVAQPSQAEGVKKKKKKKKKSKLLGNAHNNVPEEDITASQKNGTDTSHLDTSRDTKLSDTHKKKVKSDHSSITTVSVEKKKKKKKSTDKPSPDIIILSGDETQTCPESSSQQDAISEEVMKKDKVKNKKNNEGNIGKQNGVGNSPFVHESEEVSAENEAKKKKKKKNKEKKVKENGSLLEIKDGASSPKKAKLEKQKKGGKASKKVKESEEEELIFDSAEECSEEFTKDLGDLLSSLNFSKYKTPGSGKEMSVDGGGDDDENGIDLEVNKSQELPETENHENPTEPKSKSRGLTEKKKMESAKTSQPKVNVGHNSDASQGLKSPVRKHPKFNREKVAKLLEEAARIQREKPKPASASPITLKQKMEGRLMAARFRMINQELYTKSSTEAKQLFKKDPASFDVYHQGYQAQVRQWPVNPLDVIIKWLSKKPKEWVVADMGCGEAALAQQVPQSCVHSLDLVAANSRVTACDMAHTPLAAASVDVVVFCLSLMGTNLKDFMMESNRVLKTGGIMKIAEVESRFADVKQFEHLLAKYGFHCTAKDTSHQYFFLFDFKKNRKLKKTATFPDIFLKPCVYKKR